MFSDLVSAGKRGHSMRNVVVAVTLLALFATLAAGPRAVQAQAAMDCLDDPVESDDLTVFDVNVGDTTIAPLAPLIPPSVAVIV